MKKWISLSRKKGFTLVEMVVVITVIAIMMAMATPSILAYAETGRQMNRENISRTIYLAAQNRLTELRVTKNLKAELTGGYYTIVDGENYQEKATEDLLAMDTNVCKMLGSDAETIFPKELALGNGPYLHYISKPKGAPDPNNPVVKLLDPIIVDKAILNDAILIEYNIRTGVVLSAFYGDRVGEFTYAGEGKDSVLGNRGMDAGGYQYAAERKQGYYGVDSTGSVEDAIQATINVWDSNEKKLPDDATFWYYKNLLYADIILPETVLTSGETFDLRINDITVEQVDFSKFVTERHFANDALPTDAGGMILYRCNDDLVDGMARFIWVLDYVNGNMADTTAVHNIAHSIGVKYQGKSDLHDAEKKLSLDPRANLRVGIEGSVSAQSINEAHPYFATETQSSYEKDAYGIKTARHLFNIRYALNGKFTQKQSIDLGMEFNKITNFAPIGYVYSKDASDKLTMTVKPFTGTYTGIYKDKSYAIKNLSINLPTKDQVGLFANIAKRADTTPSSMGLCLQNPSVSGHWDVGAFCGILNGFVSNLYVTFPEEAEGIVSGSIQGAARVGGMVGQNNGLLTDATFISPTEKIPVEGTDKASTGGIAGLSTVEAMMQRVLYLALAPKSGDGNTLFPFVGEASASKPENQAKLYYLTGKVDDTTRPTAVQMGDNGSYNPGEAMLGEGLGTYDMYQLAPLTQLSGTWSKNTAAGALTETQTLDANNTRYPYPFLQRLESMTAQHPNWPIVIDGQDDFKARTLYYEVYADDLDPKTPQYGLSGLDAEGKGLQNNRKILEDGYLLYCDKTEDWDAINTPGNDTKIFVSSSSTGLNYAYANKNVGRITENIQKLGGINAILLDMTQLENVALGSNTLYMKLSKGTSSPKIYFEGYINPLFADAVYTTPQDVNTQYKIRTPRQLNNIGHTKRNLSKNNKNFYEDYKKNYVAPNAGSYIQEISIDFAGLNKPNGYQKRSYVSETGQSSSTVDISKSVVAASFAGTYDGNNKEIQNLAITEKTAPNRSLFQTNGQNGRIKNLTLNQAAITGGANVGGIAGENAGLIERVTLKNVNLTGTKNVGGIAGTNSNKISLSSVRYASASASASAGGIVGTNTDSGTVEDVYFLSVNETTNIPVKGLPDKTGGIVGVNAGTVKNALYIAPAPKNATSTTIYPIVGSGRGSATTSNGTDTCFYLDGSRYSLDKGNTWKDEQYNRLITPNFTVSGGGTGMISKFMDKAWLEFAYEATFGNWAQPASGYIYPLILVLTKPTEWPMTDSPARPDQKDRSDWAPIQATSNRAGNIDFINGDFEMPLMDPSNVSQTHPILSQNDWNASVPPFIQSGGFYAYYDYHWMQGWATRPVNPAGYENPKWIAMEFQRPDFNGGNGRVRTDYNGGMDGVYAELNADERSTLYQICKTKPGTEMYYSFYHAKRHDGGTDTMTFYLSGMKNVGGEWTYTSAATPIRPCTTPRGSGASSTAARNTVRYDNAKFYYPTTKQTQVANGTYLYDVWLSDLGYGITFCSNEYKDIYDYDDDDYYYDDDYLPTNGVKSISSLFKYFNSDVEANVIGYWDVEGTRQWKQYYGLYTVPAGQETTEFAYESNSGTTLEGNYLDGISFQSPAFLSVDQAVKTGATDVKFVKPGDEITIELNVKNWGEVTAKEIVLKDKLSPFDEYIDFVAGSGRVQKTGSTGTNVNVEMSATNELTIVLPDTINLARDESLKVSFQIKVRDKLKSIPQTSTLLYYFRNQAVVQYKDAGFNGYQNLSKQNGSNVTQIFVDPISLSKTVSDQNLVDGTFKVNLQVKSSLGVTDMKNNGLISEVIPEGFEMESLGTLPADATVVNTEDGSKRLTIPKVNFDTGQQSFDYHYTLKYKGNGYGVFYTSVNADYKYFYKDTTEAQVNGFLEFPKPVIGVSVKPKEDNCQVTGPLSEVFDITANDALAEKHADDNYDVMPEIVLTDQAGNPVATNAEGNYQLSTDNYTATLLKSTGQLQFKPLANADGTYELYYRVMLVATKTGGTPDRFDLSSSVTKVTVNVSGSNKLVYFEQYADGAYGFYSGESGGTLPSLDAIKVITNSGYGVLSKLTGRTAQLKDEKVVATTTISDVWNLYIFPTTAVTDFALQAVSFGETNRIELIGKLHPNFAKAIYKPSATDAGNTFYIRTPQQKLNMTQVTTTGKTFIPERGLILSQVTKDTLLAGLTQDPLPIVSGTEKDMTNASDAQPSAEPEALPPEQGQEERARLLDADLLSGALFAVGLPIYSLAKCGGGRQKRGGRREK